MVPIPYPEIFAFIGKILRVGIGDCVKYQKKQEQSSHPHILIRSGHDEGLQDNKIIYGAAGSNGYFG
jgi:hypothetical protein